MIEFDKGKRPIDETQRQKWLPLKTSEGGYTAYAVCPNGHLGILSDHMIDDDGKVSPSVVCPAPGCNFHDYVRLKGWREHLASKEEQP